MKKKLNPVLKFILSLGLSILIAFLIIEGIKLSGYNFKIVIEKTQPDSLTLPNKVVMSNELNDKFNTLFKSQNEYVACLEGSVSNDSFIITGYYIPFIMNQTEDSIQYQNCNFNTIGTLHSHPVSHLCELSQQDLFTFGATSKDLTCVQCANNNYGCFTPEDFNKRLVVQII